MSRAEYAREWKRLDRAMRGGHPLHPRSSVQPHVDALLAAGMTPQQIADAAGLSKCAVSGVTRGAPSGHVRHRTAIKLLSVRIGTAPTPIGITRRVQALSARGWSAGTIARTAGLNRETIKDIRLGKYERNDARVMQAIVAAYDALAMRPAPSVARYERASRTRLINLAARNGWAPPLAWDDETIDDPAATPTGAGYVETTVADQIRELAAMGLTEPAICDRLGAKPSTVQRTLERSKERDAA